MLMGASGVPVKERTSLGLLLYAKLVECLSVQMGPLSRNGFYLALDCILN